MTTPDRGNLTISGDGFAINLELFDPSFQIDQDGDQVQLPAEIIRERQINRIGRNFKATLEELTTRAETVAKHVQILERLHGNVFDDNFRFVADKLL